MLTNPGLPVPTGALPPADAVWVRMNRYIGDSVMIHQALEPLRAMGVPLVAWGPAPVVDLFRGSPAFQGAWADPAPRSGAFALAQVLRRARASAVLALTRSARPLMAGLLAGVPRRIGWREGGGFLAATSALAFYASPDHQLDRYAALIARAWPDADLSAPARPFVPRPEAFVTARERLQAAGLPQAFLALCLGAASTVKRLPVPTWVALIRHLRAQGRPHALLGASAEDRGQAEAILQACPGTPSLVGRMDLPTSAAVLGRAAGLVGNDSGLSHLAAACGIPVVVGFGPTDPGRTLPRGRVQLVRLEGLDCLACMANICRLGDARCLRDLDPATLLAAVDRLY
jgi:heptosyltransferase-2